MSAKMTVRLSGPLFTALPAREMDKTTIRIRERISTETEIRIHAHLRGVLRNPTGYYQSRIVVDRRTADTDLVHDSRVVYGPWLEGTSRRNAETRFKGYHTFRIVAQGMENRAVDIAREEVARLVAGLS